MTAVPSAPGTAPSNRRPLAAALTICVTIQVLGIFFSIALSSIAFTAAAVFFAYLALTAGAETLRPGGIEIPIVVYLLAVAAMAVTAEYSGAAFSNSRRVLLIATAYFIPAAFRSERSLRLFVLGILAAAALQSVADILVYYSQSYERLGFFQHYMTSAGMKMMALLLAMPLALRRGETATTRIAAAAASAVVLLALVLTQTRSSWLGFAAGALLIGVLAHRRLLPALPALGLAFLLLAPESLHQRVERMFSTAADDSSPIAQSNISRLRMWSVGWQIFLEHPVFGAGDGEMGRVYRRYAPDAHPDEGGHLHSTYVHILASHGLFGFAAVALLFLAILRLMWRAFRSQKGGFASEIALGALSAFAAFLVNGLAEYNFGDHEMLVLMWTAAGVTVAASRLPCSPVKEQMPAAREHSAGEAARSSFPPGFPLSVIIITKNEEINIGECMQSVCGADDIIVVDADSADATAEIARSKGATVLVRKWLGFSEAKTLALEHARHQWILWLDADERVTAELSAEIRSVVDDPKSADAYQAARRALFLGREIRHCGWYPGYVTRLFRKSNARFSDSRVHEGLEVSGSVGRLKNDLLHFTDRNLHHYFTKLNRYTSLAAEDMSAAGKRASMADIILRPLSVFIKMYVLKAGFLDGKHGYILCKLSAAYVLAKYAKLWEKELPGRPEEGEDGI